MKAVWHLMLLSCHTLSMSDKDRCRAGRAYEDCLPGYECISAHCVSTSQLVSAECTSHDDCAEDAICTGTRCTTFVPADLTGLPQQMAALRCASFKETCSEYEDRFGKATDAACLVVWEQAFTEALGAYEPAHVAQKEAAACLFDLSVWTYHDPHLRGARDNGSLDLPTACLQMHDGPLPAFTRCAREDMRCIRGTRCSGALCLPVGQVGETCDADGLIRACPGFCDPQSGRCSARLPAGSLCTFSRGVDPCGGAGGPYYICSGDDVVLGRCNPASPMYHRCNLVAPL